MSITSTQSKGSGSVVNIAVGRYLDTGTVASFTITTGFRPRYVKVSNVTSRDQMEWFEGMTDDTGVKTVAAGTRTLSASLGITDNANGFTMGLDTDVVVTSQQISWLALG